MAKMRSVKKTTVIVPKSIEETAEFIATIGERQRRRDQIQARFNQRIEKIKAAALEASLPYQREIDQFFEGIFVFAQEHRDELTEKGKKKTVNLPTGEIQWRLNPPSISFKKGWNNDKVVALCKSLSLERFIRTKEEVDKETMLKEQEVVGKIEGVKIEQKEQFGVKPAEIGIEIFRDTKKLQKVLPKK